MKSKELEFTIERLDRFNFEDAITAGRTFFAESDFSQNMTPDENKYRSLIYRHIGAEHTAGILAVTPQGKVIGYAYIYCQNDYTVELVGEMFQFYVLPEARGTMVARSIVQEVVKQFDIWGCVRNYAEAAPGLSDARVVKLFSNLWGKFGFKPVGQTFIRSK